MFWHLFRYSLLRLSRSYLAMALLVLTPLGLISVIGLVSGQIGASGEGRTGMDWIAASFVIGFQTIGGSYTLHYFHEDLFRPFKWRMRSLPLRIDAYGYSLLLASTLFSAFQGLVLILFTDWVYGANWGPLPWVMLVVLTVSFLSQLVCLLLVLTARRFKTAERLSEVYGLGSMLLAGIMFPLPNTPFFDFLSTYGNPISLGMNAIFAMAHETDKAPAYVFLGLLLAATAICAGAAALLGRKRLI